MESNRFNQELGRHLDKSVNALYQELAGNDLNAEHLYFKIRNIYQLMSDYLTDKYHLPSGFQSEDLSTLTLEESDQLLVNNILDMYGYLPKLDEVAKVGEIRSGINKSINSSFTLSQYYQVNFDQEKAISKTELLYLDQLIDAIEKPVFSSNDFQNLLENILKQKTLPESHLVLLMYLFRKQIQNKQISPYEYGVFKNRLTPVLTAIKENFPSYLPRIQADLAFSISHFDNKSPLNLEIIANLASNAHEIPVTSLGKIIKSAAKTSQANQYVAVFLEQLIGKIDQVDISGLLTCLKLNLDGYSLQPNQVELIAQKLLSLESELDTKILFQIISALAQCRGSKSLANQVLEHYLDKAVRPYAYLSRIVHAAAILNLSAEMVTKLIDLGKEEDLAIESLNAIFHAAVFYNHDLAYWKKRHSNQFVDAEMSRKRPKGHIYEEDLSRKIQAELKNRGIRFRVERNIINYGYEFDICFTCYFKGQDLGKIDIEYDGARHQEVPDSYRDAVLSKLGIKVIRVPHRGANIDTLINQIGLSIQNLSKKAA